MSHALLIIDLQNDYFPGGKMTLVNVIEACTHAKQLLTAYREHQLPRYHIQHIATTSDAPFFVANTHGAHFFDDIQPLPGEKIIQKHYPNCFRDTHLHQQLQADGITHLTICGAMSHMCIDAAARAACDLGYECTVVDDACATLDLQYQGNTIPAHQVHGAFMSALSPLYAQLKNTADIINTL